MKGQALTFVVSDAIAINASDADNIILFFIVLKCTVVFLSYVSIIFYWQRKNSDHNHKGRYYLCDNYRIYR